MKRTTSEIKKRILQILTQNGKQTYAELERKVNTNWYTIKNNCDELEKFGAVEIKKLNKHDANGRPFFEVKITNTGREVLKKL